MKICHVTCVHPSYDARIFYKECLSLAQAGHEVYLVAKGESREEEGIHVIGIGEEPSNRIQRMILFSKKAYLKAMEIECDIYHLHDPELLPYAKKIKRSGKKVVFDSHEDVAEQIYDKEWIPLIIRKIVSKLYHLYETSVVKRLDAVIAATPYIGELFCNRARKIAIVNNYPKLDEIEYHTNPFIEREAIVCFAGSIDELYGHSIMLKAMENIQATLLIAGDHNIETTKNIKYLGRLDRKEINDLYGRAVAGLCFNLPRGNFINSQPTKMFEYMAAGLPVICSDFPHWKEIIEQSEAGICVDSNDVQKIKDAIDLLLSNRRYANLLSLNGRKAAEEKYNWNVEKKSLYELYENI